MGKSQLSLPSRESSIYTSCYCEENVWHLCKQITQHEKRNNRCYCVFMSNHLRAVHLWKQKICGHQDQYVIWDYHVFAVYGNDHHGYWVLDLDTLLEFPVPFKEYAEKAIRSENDIPPAYSRYFRIISAEDYLKYFSSDRRHMRIGETSWQKPPPTYPAIISNPENPHNLNEFINMEKGKGYGEVLNCKEFVKKFSK